jgi:putative Holliday junction resolvase
MKFACNILRSFTRYWFDPGSCPLYFVVVKILTFSFFLFPFSFLIFVVRILALDPGTRRIGVAVSDETKTIAQPLEWIPAEPFAGFLDRLRQILVEKEVDLVLIGLPRNMNGTYGPAAQKAETFAAALKAAITVPIEMRDERLTTLQANKMMIQGNVRREKRKDKVDKMAAALLLQSYLDAGS